MSAPDAAAAARAAHFDQAIVEQARLWLGQGGSDAESADRLVHFAALNPPEAFMHVVPPGVQRALREASRQPPASIDDIDVAESPLDAAALGDGLSDAEIAVKTAAAHRAKKRRILDGQNALHRFFERHPPPA